MGYILHVMSHLDFNDLYKFYTYDYLTLHLSNV